MSTPPKDELIFVEKFLREGRLEEALQLAKDLENVTNLDINDKMEAKTLQLEILFLQNDHEHVLKLADIIINLSNELNLPFHRLDGLSFKVMSLRILKKFKERDDVIKQLELSLERVRNDEDAQFIKREIYYHKIKGSEFLEIFEFEQSLESYNRALSLNEKLNNMYQNAMIINSIADVYFYYGHLDVALQNYETSLSISKELGYKSIEASVYHMLAGLKFKEDQLKKALEYEMKSGEIFRKLNDKYNLAFNRQYLGYIYRGLGELDKSLECLLSARDYFKKIGHTAREINVLINIIGFYKSQGEYDKALSSLDTYYKLNAEMQDQHCLGIAHHWYGMLYSDKGELNQALEHYEKSLEILQNFKSLDTLGHLYFSLGELHLKKGDLDKSLEYHLLSLEFKEKMQMGDKLSQIASSLKCLIDLYLILEENELAIDYLDRLEILASETDNLIIESLYLLSKSVLLKFQGTPETIAESKHILSLLVNKKQIAHSITIDAILNLCELLLAELGITEDISLLMDTKAFILKLITIAAEQNLYPLLAQTYLLQAQLSLMEIKIEDAKYFLSKAQQIAEEQGLERLAIQISNEYDSILDKLDTWTDFTMNLPRIAEKLELTHIELMLNQMIKKRLIDFEDTIKEEEAPNSFFILNSSGTILFSETFDDQLEGQNLDQFLEILRELEKEEAHEMIQRDRFQEFTYLSKKIGSFLYCYIFVGKAYTGINKMKNFFTEIKIPSPIRDMLDASDFSGQSISLLNRMAISQTVNNIFLKKG
jgi:tetratricopeptide (TPR) repeat protein